MVEIVPLANVDPGEIEALLDAAFGDDRRTRTAYRLREGVKWFLELSFAGIAGGKLIGTVQCWPVALDDGSRQTALTLVGPVAVLPDKQRTGIGRALMTRCLETASEHGHDALVMIGDPEYYGRFFGFSAEATAGWKLPGPVEQRRLLVRVGRPGGVPPTGLLGPDPAFASAVTTA